VTSWTLYSTLACFKCRVTGFNFTSNPVCFFREGNTTCQDDQIYDELEQTEEKRIVSLHQATIQTLIKSRRE
jgi:hypothetical protein